MKWMHTYDSLLASIDEVDMVKYARTRNYLNGDVTQWGPYISRGVISVPQIIERLAQQNRLNRGSEKFLQQLIWREFWQQQAFISPNLIKLNQQGDRGYKPLMPKAVLEAQTKISVLDQGLRVLYQDGFMHNHLRLYMAALVCNVAKQDYYWPSKWLYYHLLDADWASNLLSWKWVAGEGRQKQYWMNQDNINRYSGTLQQGGYLDCSYEELVMKPCPELLKGLQSLELLSDLPSSENKLNHDQDMALYTPYNLDPLWLKDLSVQRVLLLEPSHFKAYPLSKKVVDFICQLGKQMISGLVVVALDFTDLKAKYPGSTFYYKEHYFNEHFVGKMTPRSFLISPGEVPIKQFFTYYKKVAKKVL